MENRDTELVERNRQTMEKYWPTHDTAYMSEDVVFRIMATGRNTRGKAAVDAMFGYFYGGGAFEAHAEIRSEIVDGDRAAAEADVWVVTQASSPGCPPPERTSGCRSPSTTTYATARSSKAGCTSRCRCSSPRSAPYRADGGPSVGLIEWARRVGLSSGPAGTRTLNQWIKSPLLCQLSYGPGARVPPGPARRR